MCVFKRGASRCSTPADTSVNWGGSGGFCEEHAKLVRGRLMKGGWDQKLPRPDKPNAEEKYVEDYIKLFALMLDKARCRLLLSALESELWSGGRADKMSGRLRLSRELERYESLCWFPTIHRLYVGSLTSQNYQSSIALGYMPKDAGAGAQHGEFSHRIQWHIVMREVTAGFTVVRDSGAWHHTPIDLFTFLGSSWAMHKSRALWGVIFDDQDGVAYNNPAILNMDLCGNFVYRNASQGHEAQIWRAENGVLSSNAKRRTEKRLPIRERALALYKERYPGDKLLGDLDLDSGVIGLIERWKKLGKPFLDTPVFSESLKNKMLNDIARTIWKEQGFQVSRERYVTDPTEPNALLGVGETLMSPSAVRGLVGCSYLRFRQDYRYVRDVGVLAVKRPSEVL